MSVVPHSITEMTQALAFADECGSFPQVKL